MAKRNRPLMQTRPEWGGPVAVVAPVVASFAERVHAVGQIVKALCRPAWRYRVELSAVAAFTTAWAQMTGWIGDPVTALWCLSIPMGGAGLVLAIPPAPPVLAGFLGRWSATRWVLALFGLRLRLAALLGTHWWGKPVLWLAGSLGRARTRRRMQAALRELRLANTSGQVPRVKWTASTAVGERVTLACRPGQSAELLDLRAEEFRAAVKSRDVRIRRDDNRSNLVYVDVVRRDPLAATADIPWADQHAEQLSAWDPVHFGMDEHGRPVRVSMVERSILLAGEPGSGKSSGEQTILCHVAKSPDAHMILIDPNRVQFSPWKDRALVFAADDAAEALAALELVQEEIGRRARLLERLPGVVRKLDRKISEAEGLPLWFVFIDELAYHTSVIGKPTGPFATSSRDVVARGRFVGIIPVFATQRPTSDVVPTSLRDLFSMRAAFRCTTHASSDVILGEGRARQGYSAVDIDITNRGMSWLMAEGQTPRRMKWAWQDDTTIADLSVTTVRYCPPAPEVLAATMPAIDPLGLLPDARRPRQRRRRFDTVPAD
jgi:S-DNA-T family DNA segregation ATPase FtsK/SpoIIIE